MYLILMLKLKNVMDEILCRLESCIEHCSVNGCLNSFETSDLNYFEASQMFYWIFCKLLSIFSVLLKKFLTDK